MIGFECLWCDHRVTLYPDALAAGSITCPACLTQVDLFVGPVSVVTPLRGTPAENDLALAA